VSTAARKNHTRTLMRHAHMAGITINRSLGGDYVDGRWVSMGVTAIAVTASVQPAGARQKQSLPEGDRAKEVISVWSLQAVDVVNRTEKRPGDIVVWNNKNFEVVELTDWTDHSNYWQAICVKVDA
jgi:hypothetical protein